jgi:hypothetical protein
LWFLLKWEAKRLALQSDHVTIHNGIVQLPGRRPQSIWPLPAPTSTTNKTNAFAVMAFLPCRDHLTQAMPTRLAAIDNVIYII